MAKSWDQKKQMCLLIIFPHKGKTFICLMTAWLIIGRQANYKKVTNKTKLAFYQKNYWEIKSEIRNKPKSNL